MRSRHKCRGPGKRGRGKRRSGEKDEMEGSGESVGARVSPNPQGKLIPSLNSRRPNSSIAEAIVGKSAGRLPQRKPPRDNVPPTQGSAQSSAEARSGFGRKRERRGERKKTERKEEKEKERKGPHPDRARRGGQRAARPSFRHVRKGRGGESMGYRGKPT